ncbi:MAG: hypothetical protein ABSB69_04865 [Solirubrobacteraceae bacterium]
MAVAHDALLVDHDHRALDPEARGERVVFARDILLHIREQRHVERVLGDEPLVRGQILRGDAHNGRVQRGEVPGAIAVGTELFGADHRVIAPLAVRRDIESGAYISHSLRSELGDPLGQVRDGQHHEVVEAHDTGLRQTVALIKRHLGVDPPDRTGQRADEDLSKDANRRIAVQHQVRATTVLRCLAPLNLAPTHQG